MIDWSDLNKAFTDFNAFFAKATTSSIHGGRSSITGHETGVHMPMATNGGHSAIGAKIRHGVSTPTSGSSKKQVVARMMENEKIKPKLPA